MTRFEWLRASFVVTVLACAVASACSTSPSPTDAGTVDAGPFGCCPDIKSGCTLRRYGRLSTPSDTCIEGFDGVVPDPAAPGWTRTTDGDGCPVWSAPKGVALITCGLGPPEDSSVPEEDASLPDTGVDASTDASTDTSTDAATDGG